MIFIGMEKDFGTKVAGLYRESTFIVTLGVLSVCVVDEDKVRRPGNHPSLEDFTEQLLFLRVSSNHRLNPVVSDCEGDVAVYELSRVTLTVVFGPKQLRYVRVVDRKIDREGTTSHSPLRDDSCGEVVLLTPRYNSGGFPPS
jgi:hypothetical protein